MSSASALSAPIVALSEANPIRADSGTPDYSTGRAYRHYRVHRHRVSRGSGARTIPTRFEQRHSIAKAAAKSDGCQLAESHHSTQIAGAYPEQKVRFESPFAITLFQDVQRKSEQAYKHQ
jgi:hypothetical protein